MRCQFCGWDNPEGKEHCEKCNKPLAKVESSHQARKTERCETGSFNPRATVRENALPVNDNNEALQDICPVCGFVLQNGECANCGYTSKTGDVTQRVVNVPMSDEMDLRKTVRPQRKGEKEQKFTLTPISEETGLQEGDPISFEGNSIDLSRNNTDPRNSTITSRTQATIVYHEGTWSIEDKSEYNTTFVQAAEKIEIKPGALILLGDQLYRFDN